MNGRGMRRVKRSERVDGQLVYDMDFISRRENRSRRRHTAVAMTMMTLWLVRTLRLSIEPLYAFFEW